MRDPEPADRGFPNPPSGASNALAAEPSAYLRQHAGNPVHWQPFGDAAFAAAAARDVPVFLSIGYAACHWCHVMAHESFEDQDTADYLNAHFVSIKVDREERPDVDAVYMTATQAISGEGGWPMSVFLLPDGRAFHAGTYFPPRPMPGRPSFRQVLEAVSEAWTERRGAVEANAATLARGIAASQPAAALRLDGPPEPLDAALLGEAVTALSGAEDRAHGGFGGAPKFPPAAVLEFLIRHAAVPSDSMPPAAAPDTAGQDSAGPGLRGPGDRDGGPGHGRSVPGSNVPLGVVRPARRRLRALFGDGETGPFRTSRKCSTTTPSCCASMSIGSGWAARRSTRRPRPPGLPGLPPTGSWPASGWHLRRARRTSPCGGPCDGTGHRGRGPGVVAGRRHGRRRRARRGGQLPVDSRRP